LRAGFVALLVDNYEPGSLKCRPARIQSSRVEDCPE
jgi:hypothetical protein